MQKVHGNRTVFAVAVVLVVACIAQCVSKGNSRKAQVIRNTMFVATGERTANGDELLKPMLVPKFSASVVLGKPPVKGKVYNCIASNHKVVNLQDKEVAAKQSYLSCGETEFLITGVVFDAYQN